MTSFVFPRPRELLTPLVYLNVNLSFRIQKGVYALGFYVEKYKMHFFSIEVIVNQFTQTIFFVLFNFGLLTKCYKEKYYNFNNFTRHHEYRSLTETQVCQYIPRPVLEATYGIILPPPGEGEDPDRAPTDQELLAAYGCKSLMLLK